MCELDTSRGPVWRIKYHDIFKPKTMMIIIINYYYNCYYIVFAEDITWPRGDKKFLFQFEKTLHG